MPRASDAQKAQRLNRARELLRQCQGRVEAAMKLARECSISPRQAHRYLQTAQQLKQPVPVSESKLAFTVKLPRSLIPRVRQYARARKLPVSEVVTRALSAAGTARTRAWVSRNQLGHTLSSWNIVWIDGCRKSWRRFMNYWCRTSVDQPVGPLANLWR